MPVPVNLQVPQSGAQLTVNVAVQAVGKIAFQVGRYWKGDHSAKAKLMEHADEFFKHPVQTEWADEFVYDWCKSGLNV